MSKKPKPATAGERIAKWYDHWTSNRTDRDGDRNLARRIDAAIRRAVRKERERCLALTDAAFCHQITLDTAIDQIEEGSAHS